MFSVLTLLIGIRYGQYVANFDQIYVPSQTPQPTYTPYPTAKNNIESYEKYVHDGCAFSFLHPTFMKNIVTSSHSAVLSGLSQKISVTCENDKVLEARSLFLDIGESDELEADGKKVKAYPSKQGNLRWILTNKRGKMVLFSVPAKLAPIIVETTSFF